ncbi:hypothetical protein WYO_1802 [Methylobacterium sp. GXF4]|nr:hypothetical protein WYO_1802 [Methylobacterium sp. GXF4]
METLVAGALLSIEGRLLTGCRQRAKCFCDKGGVGRCEMNAILILAVVHSFDEGDEIKRVLGFGHRFPFGALACVRSDPAGRRALMMR